MTPSGGAPAPVAAAKPAKASAPAAKKTPAAPEKRESAAARPIERPPVAPAADKSPAAPDRRKEPPPPPVAAAPAANMPPPVSSEDDDRYAAMDESSMTEEEPGDWAHSVSLAELAKEDLGPSNVRREVLALEAAVKRVPADVRDMLENELKATFREVRPYTTKTRDW